MPKKKAKSKKAPVENNLLNENLFWIIFLTAFVVGTVVGTLAIAQA